MIKKSLRVCLLFPPPWHTQNMTDDRAQLPAGKQKEFLEQAIIKIGGLAAVAGTLKVSERTVRDWRREKFTMPYSSLIILSRSCRLPTPEGIQREKRFWYVAKGARRGGLASYKKQCGVIGDPAVRKQKWREWWKKECELKTHPFFHRLPFHAAEPSIKLAEFFGIALGDGGMTPRHITITLHHIDDLPYSRFVVRLIETLFHISPAVYHIPRKSINNIVVSRSNLVEYLHALGLPFGNKVKQYFDIPPWIKENRDYMTACGRGLVDTDGCVFTHRYRINGKLYSYKKMDFCSYSPPLVNTVKNFLETLGIRAQISGGVDVRIESKAGIERYIRLIGSHNEKHLKKWGNAI
jgi:hypothetical protein